MHVFEELTGINLNKMGAEMQKKDEQSAEVKAKIDEERKQKEAEEEAR